MTNVKARRLELQLKQRDVAKAAQVSYRGYQDIEAGKRIPNVFSAQRIASVLDSTVEELFPVCGDAKTADRESSGNKLIVTKNGC